MRPGAGAHRMGRIPPHGVATSRAFFRPARSSPGATMRHWPMRPSGLHGRTAGPAGPCSAGTGIQHPHRLPLRRSAGRTMGGNRPGEGRVDNSGQAHEGRACPSRPLEGRALEILKAFPGWMAIRTSSPAHAKGKPLSGMAMAMQLRRMKRETSPFTASARLSGIGLPNRPRSHTRPVSMRWPTSSATRQKRHIGAAINSRSAASLWRLGRHSVNQLLREMSLPSVQ